MLPTAMSPSQQGYAAESLEPDLESRSDQTGEPAIEEVEEGRNKYLQKAGSKDSRFMHPDDSHSALWGAGESELAGPCVAIVSRIMINFRLLAVLRLAWTLVRNHGAAAWHVLHILFPGCGDGAGTGVYCRSSFHGVSSIPPKRKNLKQKRNAKQLLKA